jgi:hypothetical protein
MEKASGAIVTTFAVHMQRVLAVLGVLFVPAIFWGRFSSHFVPNKFGLEVALTAALLAALVGAIGSTSWIFSFDTPGFAKFAAVLPFAESKATRMLGFAVILFTFTFVAVQRGYLDWWTAMTGVEGTALMHASDTVRLRHARCEGFNLIESPYLTPAICSTERPARGALVLLEGKVSPVGVGVERVNLRISPLS